MPDKISPAAFDLLKAHLAENECELGITEAGGYVVVDMHDKRVLFEVDDLAELARANGISPFAA